MFVDDLLLAVLYLLKAQVQQMTVHAVMLYCPDIVKRMDYHSILLCIFAFQNSSQVDPGRTSLTKQKKHQAHPTVVVLIQSKYTLQNSTA